MLRGVKRQYGVLSTDEKQRIEQETTEGTEKGYRAASVVSSRRAGTPVQSFDPSCAKKGATTEATEVTQTRNRTKRIMGIKAHIRPVPRIPLCLRAFSDFLMNAGGDMKSENLPRVTTQVIGWQSVAAMAGGSP